MSLHLLQFLMQSHTLNYACLIASDNDILINKLKTTECRCLPKRKQDGNWFVQILIRFGVG